MTPAAPSDPRRRQGLRAGLVPCALGAALTGAVAASAAPAPDIAPAVGAETSVQATAERPPAPVPERPVGLDTLELMRVSGLDAQLEGIAAGLVEALAEGFAAADGSGEPARARLAARVGARLFSVERLRDAVARRADAMLDAPSRATLLRHLDSGPGRRALAAERDAVDDPAALERFASRGRGDPDHEARLTSMTELMMRTGADDLVSRLAGDAQRVALHGELVADPAGRGAGFDERLDELEWHRGIVRFMLGRELPALLAHTYRELSAADVEAMLDPAVMDAQRRLLEALHSGVHDAVLAFGADFGPRYRAAVRRAGNVPEEIPGKIPNDAPDGVADGAADRASAQPPPGAGPAPAGERALSRS